MFHDLFFLLLMAACAGFAGYSAGLFGLGGGVVLVPAFLGIFTFFDVDSIAVMHAALGTSLALVIPAGFSSAMKHKKLGNLDLSFFWKFVPYIIIGCIIGNFLIRYTPAVFLKWFFTGYLFSIAIYGYWQHHQNKIEIDGNPGNFVRGIGGTLIGSFSTLLGVGGGTFIIPFLRAAKYPIKKAIAISSLCAVAIGMIGTLGAIINGWHKPGLMHFSIGYVNAVAFFICAPIVYWAAPYGAHMAHKIKKETLNLMYISFLLLLGIYMAIHSLLF